MGNQRLVVVVAVCGRSSYEEVTAGLIWSNASEEVLACLTMCRR